MYECAEKVCRPAAHSFFFISLIYSTLRVVSRLKALLCLNSGGVSAWRIDGRDAQPVQRVRRRLGFRSEFGFMLVDQSGGMDLIS